MTVWTLKIFNSNSFIVTWKHVFKKKLEVRLRNRLLKFDPIQNQSIYVDIIDRLIIDNIASTGAHSLVSSIYKGACRKVCWGVIIEFSRQPHSLRLCIFYFWVIKKLLKAYQARIYSYIPAFTSVAPKEMFGSSRN